ncbi:MAG TPA: putative LPS assembly protein LptD [Vicinamibacterales bacterium]|nr:putative LPS assembly protein LptD [Vicinamibacterales bacterium]
MCSRLVACLRPPLACALALVLGSAVEAAAQIVPGWNTKQFTLERLDADRIRLMREVEIEGEKGSPNEGQKFFADNVELNTRTGELTASGNVVFSTVDARVSADTVVFNTRTKRGTFTNASGIASLGERGQRDRAMFGTLEPDVYFYGEVIEKIDIDKYRITRGAFTTCVQPTPRWEIASGSSIVNLHDYALLNNAIIRVKDVPVFYLPVMYYPIQDDDRATGFLLPTYGRSTYRGQSLSNAFFWALSRNQDATFFHDWFFSRGQGGGTEYRYILSPQSQGNFRLYGLKEDENTTGGATNPARTSYQVAGNVTQALPAGLRGRVRVDYFSDITAQQLYNNNIYQQTFSTRSYGGGVSGAWRGLSVSGQYQRTESFYNSNDSFVSGQAPGVTASFSGRRLGRLPVYASVNTDASKVLWQQRSGTNVADFGIGKFDLLPSIRAPLSTLPFLSLNASVGYRVTFFSESLNPATGRQIEEPVTRRYADMRAEVVGPVFTRVFNPGNAFAERLKHVIEPNFTVQRITSIDNLKQIPTTASYEYVVGGVTRITYGLTNRMLVRRPSPSATPAGGAAAGAPREFLTVGINQSYYSNELASPFDQSYGYSSLFRPPSNFSTVALVTRAMPAQSVGMDFRMEYDPIATERQLVGFGLNGILRSPRVDTSAGWNRQNYQTGNQFTSNNYIQQTTTLRLAGNTITGTVQFNYDIARSTMLNQRYIANYNAQCCGLVVEFQSFNYPGGFVVNQDRRFNVSFTLAGIGSFSNFMGTFGGSTY